MGAQMHGCLVSWRKEAPLVVIIGLSKGHPGMGLYVHLAGCQNYLKHWNYRTHTVILLFENIDFIVLSSQNTTEPGT